MAPAKPRPPFDGGCACDHVRYRMTKAPLFVHCCHCTRCQRQTGGPFAHHAMIEFTALETLQGEPEFVLVPSDSGSKHWVARCPKCQTAMWNEHGTRKAVLRYVRVGTLDEPNHFPPLAHIFVRSKQPWVQIDGGTPAHDGEYDRKKTWPAASMERLAAANAARAAQRKAS